MVKGRDGVRFEVGVWFGVVYWARVRDRLGISD